MSNQIEEIMDMDDNMEDPVEIPEINDYQENENHYERSSPIGHMSQPKKKDNEGNKNDTKDVTTPRAQDNPAKEVALTTVETTSTDDQKKKDEVEEEGEQQELKKEPPPQEKEKEEKEEEPQLKEKEEEEEEKKLYAGDTLPIVSKAKAIPEGKEWVPIEVEITRHLDSLIHDEKKSDITGVLEASVKAQETMGEGLLERMTFHAEVLRAVHNHFHARASAAESYAAAAGSLPPMMPGAQNLLGTSLENGLEYLKRVGRTESDSFSQMGKFLREVCKELVDLQAEITAEHKRHTAENAHLVHGLRSQLEVVLNSYRAAMSGLETTQKNVKALAQPGARDPWISQLKYYGTLVRLNALQGEYSSHLANLAKATKAQELRQCTLIESVGKRFLTFENTVFTKIITDIQIATDMFSKVSPESDWDVFIKSHPLTKFIPEDGLDKECSKKCIPYHENMGIDSNSSSSLSVVHCGEMEYGGLVSWKKYVAVLTNFGFLHLFAKKKSGTGFLRPSPKAASQEQEKTPQDAVGNGQEGKLKESNDTGNSNTEKKEGGFTLIPTEDPQITIPVTRCKMVVTENKTIRMTHVVPGTFFSSTVAHEIRLGSTDDLVSWMIDLRHFMSPVTSK